VGQQTVEMCSRGHECAISPAYRLAAERRLVSEPGGDDRLSGRLSGLARTIEGEIIPRLMLSRRTDRAYRRAEPEACGLARSPKVIEAADIADFVNIVLTPDAGAAIAYVEAVRHQGVALQTIYLDLLAPAARRLGRLWDEDLCDFATVTAGLGRLQQVLRELSPAFRNAAQRGDRDYRALLAPLPGDQHTFGLIVVAEFFLRAGWDVWGGPRTSSDELPLIVGGEWFDLVGISAGSEGALDDLAAEIRVIRRASRNQALAVMVGGPIFVEHPEFVAMVGADATAVDGRQAPLQAEELIARLAARR
jgi:methanogenic corrinoid protein MtbC1